ncbi:MAG: cytochrome c3 family protein [Phycisphaerales bacterium]|nr:cytochrome c3 family protein [Phycisphaerales bacterium]
MDPDVTHFPRWTNGLRAAGAVAVLSGGAYATAIVLFGFSPYALDVGYQPVQPVPYSHALHAGELGMDCRYCHTTVDKGAKAGIPPLETCMGCHAAIRSDSEKLKPLREAYDTGQPLRWVRVHDLPDYVYFDHSAHVNRGVGCVSCHGRIDQMEVVYQQEPLSMNWCLDCHREPNKNVRPLDKITAMDFVPDEWKKDATQAEMGDELVKQHNLKPSTDCSTCHR